MTRHLAQGAVGNAKGLAVCWTLRQLRDRAPGVKFGDLQPKAGICSVFGSGTQSDWYAAGMLLMQLAFLVAGVWFASNFLKAIRGFQEQVGALVKLSVTGAPAEQGEASTIARRTLGEGSFIWAQPAQAGTVGITGAVERGANRVWGGSERFSGWEIPPVRTAEAAVRLQTDTSEEQRSGSWGRIGSWLRTPMKASVVNPEVTGLRRMVQWLGAPAGS